MRLALVSEIPAPFRIPLWNALAAVADVDLRVLLLAERDPRRVYDLHRDEWRFDAHVLPGRDCVVRDRWIVLSRGVRRELEAFRPDAAVVGGWNQPAFFTAARAARRGHVPLVAWVESTMRDERPRSVMLERLKRRFVASAAAFIVPGRAAAEYVESLGVGPERITVAPNAADQGLFSVRVDQERQRRDELRRRLGISGCCFLCVSRLSREKGVDVLVRAFTGVPGELVVIGDGPLRDDLRREAAPSVRFLGRTGRDELPPWYAAADAFVLASRSETWGMALTEAAVAGLPLVATEAVGAAHDLIEPGVNGLRVEVDDVGQLRDALVDIASDEELRARAGARSRALTRGLTPERWAGAVADLARRLVA